MTTHEQTQKPFKAKSRFFQKRKFCHFCMNKISDIDYKDTATLRRYISDQNKMESSRKTGVCPKHQRGLSTAIKRARILSLVPTDASHGSGRLSNKPHYSQNRNSENTYRDNKSSTSRENTAAVAPQNEAENPAKENTASVASE